MQPGLTILLLLRRVDCNDGVASYIDTLISGLKGQGCRVVIASGPVSIPPGSRQRYDAIKKGALDWIEIGKIRFTPWNTTLLRQLKRIAQEHRTDVISPQGLATLPLASVLGRLAGLPVVANYHPSVQGRDAAAMTAARPFADVWAHRIVLNLFTADRFIALSSEIAGFYRDVCAVRPKRIAYLPCAINTDEFWPPDEAQRTQARTALGLTPDTLVCVLTGRLNLNKGHDVAVAALRLLRAERPRLRIVCLFPGSGDQEREIKAQALRDEADAHSFRFLGFVPDLRSVYWASDIGLLPSRREGFGIAIAEAMCSGCVPIRTPSGGARDQIIEGETGYVVPFDDPAALARRIADLAEPERRARMREAAVKHASTNFNTRIAMERTAALYREVALGWRARRGVPARV